MRSLNRFKDVVSPLYMLDAAKGVFLQLADIDFSFSMEKHMISSLTIASSCQAAV